MELFEKANQIFSIGTIGLQVIILALIFILIFIRKKELFWIVSIIKKNIIYILFTITLIATLGSFFYSEIIGLAPCAFCWYARTMLFPQVIILGIAIFKKKATEIYDYILGLSIIGA